MGSAGWTWNSSPRVLSNGVKTWAGVISGSGIVAVVEYPGGAVTPIYDGAFVVDDHVNPVLLRRSSDGRLIAVWTEHSGDVWWNVSTDPDDATSWQGEANITGQLGAGDYTYPRLFELSGGIHLFLRDGSASAADTVHTTLSGSTWSPTETWLPGGVYVHITQDDDRLYVASTKSPVDEPEGKLRAGYWEDDQWYASDGSEITPVSTSDLTLVQDVMRPRGLDIVMGDSGPVILFQHYATYPSDSRYRYAVWDGDSWGVEEIAAAGGVLDGPITFNVGGGYIDRLDHDIAYLSRKVSGVWQLFRYVKDGTWSGEPLTDGEDDQIRPACAEGPSPIRVLWLSGTYDSQTSFDMDLAVLSSRVPASVSGSFNAWPSMRP